MPYAVADTITIADAYIEWLLDDFTIQTEAPGGVWNEAAEQGTGGRIIRYAFQRSLGLADFGGMQIINDDLIYERLLYLVIMNGEAGDRFADLQTGASRIKELLHKGQSDVTFTAGKILWSKYLAPHKARPPEGDHWYPELGGYYEIAVQTPFTV